MHEADYSEGNTDLKGKDIRSVAGRQRGLRPKSSVSLEWQTGDFGQWLGGRDMLCVASVPSDEHGDVPRTNITVTGSQVPVCITVFTVSIRI